MIPQLPVNLVHNKKLLLVSNVLRARDTGQASYVCHLIQQSCDADSCRVIDTKNEAYTGSIACRIQTQVHWALGRPGQLMGICWLYIQDGKPETLKAKTTIGKVTLPEP